jgi:hypothetical protein
LFSSWRLTDPNILKRSFAEAVNENSIFNWMIASNFIFIYYFCIL